MTSSWLNVLHDPHKMLGRCADASMPLINGAFAVLSYILCRCL
jgi:hypothetical protein